MVTINILIVISQFKTFLYILETPVSSVTKISRKTSQEFCRIYVPTGNREFSFIHESAIFYILVEILLALLNE